MKVWHQKLFPLEEDGYKTCMFVVQVVVYITLTMHFVELSLVQLVNSVHVDVEVSYNYCCLKMQCLVAKFIQVQV